MRKYGFIFIFLIFLLFFIPTSFASELSVDNSNFDDYFSDSGVDVVDGSVINLVGDFNEKTFVINKSVTLTSTSNARLYNSSVILDNGSSGSIVSNLYIVNSDENYQYGIRLTNTNNNVIRNNIIISNYFEIGLTNSNYNNLVGNNVTSLPDASGRTHTNVLLTNSNYNIIDSNIVNMGYANGIYLSVYSAGSTGGSDSEGGQFNKIINNRLVSYLSSPDSWNYAIQVMDSNNLIENNVINGAYRGISTSKFNNTVRDNVLNKINGDFAIISSGNSSVSGNVVDNSSSIGVYLTDNCIFTNNFIKVVGSENGVQVAGDNVQIYDNVIVAPNSYGVCLSQGLNHYDNVSIISNVINGSVGVAGLIELSKPSNVMVRDNVIKASGLYAVNSYGDNVSVVFNQLESSGYMGDGAVRLLKSVNGVVENNSGFIRDTKIIVNDIVCDDFNPVIPVKVLDIDNNLVPTGKVTLNVTNQLYESNIQSGVTNIKIKNLKVGEYTLNIKYISNLTEYKNSQTQSKLTIKNPIKPTNNTNTTNTTNTTNNTNTTPTNNTTNTTNTTNNTNIINTTITTENLIKIYGTNDTFKGKLLTNNQTPLPGQHIKLKLTRLSSGASKTYDVVTDYKGEFNLPINLAIGLYSCQIEYSETQINNITYTTSNQNATITVINEISNKNITILTTEKFNNPYQANKSFTGQLTTLSTNILPGQHISIKLTRLSSGASKTYDTVTDYTGTFKLQINLAPGEYIGQCTYTGTDKYQPSTNTNTITVY